MIVLFPVRLGRRLAGWMIQPPVVLGEYPGSVLGILKDMISSPA